MIAKAYKIVRKQQEIINEYLDLMIISEGASGKYSPHAIHQYVREMRRWESSNAIVIAPWEKSASDKYNSLSEWYENAYQPINKFDGLVLILMSACFLGWERVSKSITFFSDKQQSFSAYQAFLRRLLGILKLIYGLVRTLRAKQLSILQKIVGSSAWTIEHLSKPLVFVINTSNWEIRYSFLSIPFSPALGLKAQCLVKSVANTLKNALNHYANTRCPDHQNCKSSFYQLCRTE